MKQIKPLPVWKFLSLMKRIKNELLPGSRGQSTSSDRTRRRQDLRQHLGTKYENYFLESQSEK
jgi:hypothetical protein